MVKQSYFVSSITFIDAFNIKTTLFSYFNVVNLYEVKIKK